MDICKAGMFSILGRPNVGKSTLLNTLLGEKVAIVSDKPQTTRHRICAVVNRDDAQYVLMDTPGIHRPRTELGHFMTRIIRESMEGADAAVWIVEPSTQVHEEEKAFLTQLKAAGMPVLLAINKIDTVKKESLLGVISFYAGLFPFTAIVPICAVNGDGCETLLSELSPFLVDGPALYPLGVSSDQPEKALVAEIVREKLLNLLDQEVPHGLAAVTEVLDTRENGIMDIEVTIFCEKQSHKGIVIGKDGRVLKRAGTQARYDLEEMLGAKVNLRIWVKVRENWRDAPAQLRHFGFE